MPDISSVRQSLGERFFEKNLSKYQKSQTAEQVKVDRSTNETLSKMSEATKTAMGGLGHTAQLGTPISPGISPKEIPFLKDLSL